MPANIWLNDFSFEGLNVRVHKTGALVPVEPGTISETMAWLRFYAAVELKTAGRTSSGPKIWFGPDHPRPWYLIWAASRLALLPIVRNADDADLGIFFEDVTTSEPPIKSGLKVLNGECGDVSKTRVSDVFQSVTGRALNVDPESFNGTIVAKSEKNGAHDGRLISAPCPAEAGLVYQKLIDNSAADGLVEDLRCPTVGGEIPVVFLKRRSIDHRFENANSEVKMLDPKIVFNADERAMISQFCEAMGLDWGGLDILKDRKTRELWIVDVNKTDMGPPTALPLDQKMRAASRIAGALRTYVERLTGA
jgi:hypothetical protein